MVNSHNTSLFKTVLTLNFAGENERNPLVVGMPLSLQVRFNKQQHDIVAILDNKEYPVKNQLIFEQDTEDELLFKFDGICGEAPFEFVNQFSFVRIILQSGGTGEQTIIDKRFYIASLPSDAIQVHDTTLNAFSSVNENLLPTVTPNVSQMCGIRFFNSFFDEFNIKKFGGAKYFSCFDFGDTETGTNEEFVKRQVNEPIEQVSRIILRKHKIATPELHDIQILLKPSLDKELPIRIKVLSNACWAHQLLDPIIN